MTVAQTGQGDTPSPSPRPRPESEADSSEAAGTEAAGPEAEISDPAASAGSVTPASAGGLPPGPVPSAAVGGKGPGPFVVALILAVVSFLVAVTFGVLWLVERHAESEREEALAAGKVFAVDVTTYNYGKIDENVQKVRSNSTDKFWQMYSEVSNQLIGLLKQYKADSKGELLHAGVAEFDGDKAVLVLIMNTTITNTNTPQPRIDRSQMVMTLVEVDNEWKMDGLALI